MCFSDFLWRKRNFKYGWYRLFLKFGFGKGLQNAQTKLQKHELSAVIFSYWEPNLASITATAAGVLQIPLRRFQIKSIIGILVWNTFWGTLVAALGAKALELIGLKWVLIVFSVLVAILLGKYYLTNRKKII